MNLSYILNQFKKIEKLETFVSSKFLSKYYNKKPLSNIEPSKEKTIIDEDILSLIIFNNKLPDKTSQQLIKHKYFIDKDIHRSPKEIIRYHLDTLNKKSRAMKKSISHTNIDIIKMNKFALSKKWYMNKIKLKHKPIIIQNEESSNMNRTVRQCLSTQIRNTTLEDHKKMIDYLEKSLKKELLFVAETIPKVTLGQFKKECLLFRKKSSNDYFLKHTKTKERFNECNSLSIISPTSNINRIINNIPLSTNKIFQTKELYEEIKRNDIDFSSSYSINKPFISLLKRKILSQNKQKHKTLWKDNQSTVIVDIMKINQDKIRNTIKKRDKLLLIIRPEK